MNSKKLTARISQKQKVVLLEHMQQNSALASGKFAGPDSAKKNKQKWEEIAEELNAVGGANKSAEQWKRCWIDWKKSTKQKLAEIKRFENRTGNLPSSSGPKRLDPLEEEVANLLVPDAVEGDGNTVEGGFDFVHLDPDVEIYMEEEYLEEENFELSNPQVPDRKRKNITAATTPPPNNSKAKKYYNSELEKAKEDLDVRLSQQDQNMKELKTELKELKEGQRHTNELLEKILKALNK